MPLDDISSIIFIWSTYPDATQPRVLYVSESNDNNSQQILNNIVVKAEPYQKIKNDDT